MRHCCSAQLNTILLSHVLFGQRFLQRINDANHLILLPAQLFLNAYDITRLVHLHINIIGRADVVDVYCSASITMAIIIEHI